MTGTLTGVVIENNTIIITVVYADTGFESTERIRLTIDPDETNTQFRNRVIAKVQEVGDYQKKLLAKYNGLTNQIGTVVNIT